MVGQDVAPAAGVVVHDLDLALSALEVVDVPRHPVGQLAVLPGCGPHDLAVDDQIDRCRVRPGAGVGMVAAADQQVDVALVDGEARRADGSGRQVVVGEGVDQSFALVAADGLLVADGSRPGAVVLEVPGGGPAGSPGVALEVGENRSGGQAGIQRGPGHARMVAAADQEVQVVVADLKLR